MSSHASRLSLANLWVAFATFFLAALMGLYQVAERSGMFPKIEFIELYFRSVSSHGVIMGFVLTTFFIMGFGYWIIHTSLKTEIWGGKKLGWLGFAMYAKTKAVPIRADSNVAVPEQIKANSA